MTNKIFTSGYHRTIPPFRLSTSTWGLRYIQLPSYCSKQIAFRVFTVAYKNKSSWSPSLQHLLANAKSSSLWYSSLFELFKPEGSWCRGSCLGPVAEYPLEYVPHLDFRTSGPMSGMHAQTMPTLHSTIMYMRFGTLASNKRR